SDAPRGSVDLVEDIDDRKVNPPYPKVENSMGDEAAAGGPPLRVLRAKEVQTRVGLSRTSIWRLQRSGDCPASRQLSPGTVGWIEAEVEVTCPPSSPDHSAASPALAVYSAGVRFPSALWGRTSL